MASCPHCSSPLETPLGCPICARLFSLTSEPSPYDVFGLETRYPVDPHDLRRRLLRFSRLTHPDFFANESKAARSLAERNTAVLNAAHEVLADDARRADWLVRHLGGPDEALERAMPREFLMDVLEWNETLEEARSQRGGSADDPRLSELGTTLKHSRAQAVRKIGDLLEPLPEPGSPPLLEVRRLLNAIRYFDRALEELEAVRLTRSGTR
jgi:DnaJ-domain-containing protein 1